MKDPPDANIKNAKADACWVLDLWKSMKCVISFSLSTGWPSIWNIDMMCDISSSCDLQSSACFVLQLGYYKIGLGIDAKNSFLSSQTLVRAICKALIFKYASKEPYRIYHLNLQKWQHRDEVIKNGIIIFFFRYTEITIKPRQLPNNLPSPREVMVKSYISYHV